MLCKVVVLVTKYTQRNNTAYHGYYNKHGTLTHIE